MGFIIGYVIGAASCYIVVLILMKIGVKPPTFWPFQ